MDNRVIWGNVSPGKGSKLKKELEDVHKQNSELKSAVSELQYESTKNNLIFYGIVDRPNEKVNQLLKGFVRDEMKVKEDVRFKSVRRMNSKSKPRPIVASFENFKQRELVKHSAYKLKGSPFGLSEQYPQDVLATRKQLLPIQKEARSKGAKAVMVRDKLYINNEIVDPLNYQQLMANIKPKEPPKKNQNGEEQSGGANIFMNSETEQTNVKQIDNGDF